MYTLTRTNFNWVNFIGLALTIKLLFPGISAYSFFAILVTIYQFTLLFNSIGYIIPIRYLFGALMCLQMFLGPAFAYNGLDEYQRGYYKMQVPEAQYFQYAFPAVCCFILGLHVTAKKFEGEKLNLKRIADYGGEQPYLPYYLIGIGFIASILTFTVASELTFLFTLLASLKYVGLFLLLLGRTELKRGPLILVFVSIITTSLGEGMFHDLLIWLIFILCVLAIKYKPSTRLKVIISVSFSLLALTIQQLKGDYREATWRSGEEAGVETLGEILERKSEKGDLFSKATLASSNIRINQGFIVTNILRNVPAREPFANGKEMAQILEAAFLPRFLAPNKLTAGSRELFVKYSGMPLKKGTSMGLSSLGDGYINYGIAGGCLFMFILGFIYSQVLTQLYKYSSRFPMLLLFSPLIFYYPIRPDCELQTSFGHLVKATFLIFFLVYFFNFIFESRGNGRKRIAASPGA
ncbi:MAG: hypothetical protein QM791_02710 [Ferruginibacter sp.]